MTSMPSVSPGGGIAALLGRGDGAAAGMDAETAGMFEAALAALLGSPALDVGDGQADGEAGEPGETGEPGEAAEAGETPGAAALAGLPAAAGHASEQAIEAILAAAGVAGAHAAPVRGLLAGAAAGGQGPVAEAVARAVAQAVEGATAVVEPTVVEPVAAEPVAAEPVAVEPDVVEPVAVEPVAGETPVVTPDGAPDEAGVPEGSIAPGAAPADPGESPAPEPAAPVEGNGAGGVPPVQGEDGGDGPGASPPADVARPQASAPTPRASDRAIEALRAASPAAAEHAAPLRAQAEQARAEQPEAPSLDAPEAVAAPPRTGESQAPARAVEVRPAVDARPAQPHEQVVSVLRPLRRGPDGTYRLSLQLHPQELGRVRLDVQMRGGELTVHLAADDDGARELIRDALPALQADLEQSGFDQASVDVGRWAADEGDDDDALTDEPGTTTSDAGTPGVEGELVTAVPAGALDVRI